MSELFVTHQIRGKSRTLTAPSKYTHTRLNVFGPSSGRGFISFSKLSIVTVEPFMKRDVRVRHTFGDGKTVQRRARPWPFFSIRNIYYLYNEHIDDRGIGDGEYKRLGRHSAVSALLGN